MGKNNKNINVALEEAMKIILKYAYDEYHRYNNIYEDAQIILEKYYNKNIDDLLDFEE